MAFNNIDQLNLGNLLQIIFSNGVRNQISQDFRDWEMVRRAKAGSSVARELRFMIQKSFGPAAIQYRDPGTSGRSFPQAQQVNIQELTAKFKEINATIELEYNLWDRARKSPEKYAEPLALEIDSKASAAKRRIAADLYGDGTGAVGEVASSSVVATNAVVVLSSSNTAAGHVGFFEYYDLLLHYTQAGATGSVPVVATGTFAYWRVVSKDRALNTVTLRAVNTLGAEVNLTSWTSVATEVFYRIGQPTIPNRTAIADYGTATEVMVGLESLVAGDGRVVHGMTMNSSTAGTRLDAAGNPIDVKNIQRVMSQVKVAVGQDRYKWSMMSMAPETLDAFIESRETDRRFTTMEDGTKGTKKFMYQHQNDSLECYTSEYVPMKRLYVLPETKASEKVIEFHGSDFETVKAQGDSDFHLKAAATGGGYQNTVVSYLQAIGVIICKHPAAVAIVENFTNS